MATETSSPAQKLIGDVAPKLGQLPSHLRLALANGLTADELVEAITHLAFYAGWPNAMTAATALKEVLAEQQPAEHQTTEQPTTAHAG